MDSFDDVIEYLRDHDMEDTVVFGSSGHECDSYASAFIGTCGSRAVYSYSKMIEWLKRDGMSDEDAIDFIEYNTMRSLPYVGEMAPIVVYDLDVP